MGKHDKLKEFIAVNEKKAEAKAAREKFLNSLDVGTKLVDCDPRMSENKEPRVGTVVATTTTHLYVEWNRTLPSGGPVKSKVKREFVYPFGSNRKSGYAVTTNF